MHARHAVGPLVQRALALLGELAQPRVELDVLGVRLQRGERCGEAREDAIVTEGAHEGVVDARDAQGLE